MRPVMLLFFSLVSLFSLACHDLPRTHRDAGPPSPYDFELDSVVDDMAAAIMAGDSDPDETAEAVAAGVRYCGFAVRNLNGNFVYPDNRQGVLFEEWNLQMMARALTVGSVITLDDYVGVVAQAMTAPSVPAVTVAPADPVVLKAALLSDLSHAAKLKGPGEDSLGTWAQLVVGLGRHSATPYDLMDAAVPGSVELNPVQVGLLTQRLAAEMSEQNREPGAAVTSPFTPCTMSDTMAIWSDVTATLSGTLLGGVVGFDGLLGRLADQVASGTSAIGRYGQATAVANALLAYVKLAWTVAAFDAHFTVDPSPLVRTQDRTPGGSATVSGHFSLDLGKWPAINCFRQGLNALGLDFTLPDNGPLVDKRVEWRVEELTFSSNNVLDMRPAQGVGGATTDSAGHAQVVVIGKPQRDILHHPIPFNRRVKVAARLNIKNNNLAQDAPDLLTGIAGPEAMVTLPAEILNRVPGILYASVMVPVVDWKDLEGDVFEVLGNYQGPAVGTTGVSDRVRILVEAYYRDTPNGSALVLGVEDSATAFTDHYDHGPYVSGEMCTETAEAVGTLEVFNYSRPLQVSSSFSPAVTVQGVTLPARGTVQLALLGRRLARGWRYTASNPDQCPPPDTVAAKSEGTTLGVTFNPADVPNAGDVTTVDHHREDGWIWTITHVTD